MIPLEIFLKFACCYSGQCSISDYPELVLILMAHPEKDKLFHIEKTTAASGPLVLWYPLSKWKEEQQRQREIDRIIEDQYKPKADPMEALFKRMEAQKLLNQMKEKNI